MTANERNARIEQIKATMTDLEKACFDRMLGAESAGSKDIEELVEAAKHLARNEGTRKKNSELYDEQYRKPEKAEALLAEYLAKLPPQKGMAARNNALVGIFFSYPNPEELMGMRPERIILNFGSEEDKLLVSAR